jgi:hypothetical protein
MHQCEVGLIENMTEIVIVVVYLGWGKLTLIDDILGRE